MKREINQPGLVLPDKRRLCPAQAAVSSRFSVDPCCALGKTMIDSEDELEPRNGLTQGDKLRALKSRRQPRSATTGALRLEEMKTHTRSTSQPFRIIASNSTPGSMSPLKSSRVSASTSAVARRVGQSSGSSASKIKGYSVNSRYAGSLGNLNSALEEIDSPRGSSPSRPSYSPAHPSSLYPSSPHGRSQGELNNNRNWNVPTAGSVRPAYTGLTSSARYLSRSIPI
ncbi:unnamed protein product [Ranitomeya imitator]|uniref:Uncharacterized protein n=1 Tax=Ranitomeya imitator TaxID=111125 RepID=A0ABN9MHE4_9NEOB|nr:unnamed protein product [Ranitomeya imitator]